MRKRDTMTIRMVQHYMYCPRRFALLEINRDWAENAFTVNSELLHGHVHDGSHRSSDKNKVVRSSVDIYNDLPEYDLYGVADCIEFIADKNGVEITGLSGKYRVQIVEYKPTAPKGGGFRDTDAIQVFAQKVCADFTFRCSSRAFLYYGDTRRRIELPFDSEYDTYDTMLKRYIKEMNGILESHAVPPRRKGQKCSGCSVADLCFPKSVKYSVKDIVMSMKEGGIS
ncbi:MAG: CRISPR-associated protein Cas4 [Ruminococcus sp.]|nr:CRISPR-associated protein Cas4 [Ruminococcus sp.]